MQDEVLNSFMQNLINKNIDEEELANQIDLFSKFIGYTNSIINIMGLT